MTDKYRGLRVRDDVVIAQVGAASVVEARDRASAALAGRGLVVEYIGTTGGERLKVGIAGLRRYSVSFRVVRGV